MQDLKAELTASVDEAEWQWLLPHVVRDSLIVVTPELNIVDVGMAIANNNVSLVQNWISQELIHKPSLTQMSDWQANLSKRFNALIVRPFVLIQEPIVTNPTSP
ncbi:hypothetical protein NIES2119_20855 [[Phormidium ambiguum] IAM M-71]|uniref:DUF2288 domain-containing protein n=1 Tax=[Phormidium ambiguum] IAM M-71 TaxID=454136 RepID=A0A1U7IE34_9CYAN|nr:DUF2288 domain-containing protein [Phormidium ambiguum]OKH35229.1 hypothetical protein NIES2119_20855 [Phormidium ambiguum IAM M-71]